MAAEVTVEANSRSDQSDNKVFVDTLKRQKEVSRAKGREGRSMSLGGLMSPRACLTPPSPLSPSAPLSGLPHNLLRRHRVLPRFTILAPLHTAALVVRR